MWGYTIAVTNETRYPQPNEWCDILFEGIPSKGKEKWFICPSAGKGRCHYAMNPYCEPNSPGDVVLLFETKAGWNQFGGPEILTTENHGDRGCNILFNDGSVKFVPPQELAMLKWKVENTVP
jgi:prepilin-type processing-associated H-X9-DG protein